MKKTRILALVLALVMVVSLFAACGGNTEPEETTDTSATTAATTEATTTPSTEVTTEATTEATTEEPGFEFPEDYTFSFFVINMMGLFSDANGERATESGKEFGELIDGIEDELGITIECALKLPFIDVETLAATLMSGDCPQDVMNTYSYWLFPAIYNGYVFSLDKMVKEHGLDVSWENSLYESSAVTGTHWGFDFTGKFTQTDMGHFYAFNTELVDASGLMTTEQLYQTIRDYKWDYDTFLNLARKIATDTDGNGQLDIFGLALHADDHEAGTNGTNIVNYVDGKFVANLTDPQLVTALNFMALICQDDISQVLTEEGFVGRSGRRAGFYAGNAGFAGLYGQNITEEDGACTATFQIGVAPLPMGPDATYYHMDRSGDLCFILSNNKNLDAVAQVLNVLGPALTNEEDYLERLKEGFNGDETCMEIITEYLIPHQRYYLEDCSRDMYFEYLSGGFVDHVYRADMTVAQAAEAYQDLVQNELNAIFHQ